MKRAQAVLVIGLDAADHRLIESWASTGKLPTFSRLLNDGAYGLLKSTAEVFSGSAWVSIATGCGPEKCGVYSRYQLVEGTYDVRRIRADDCRMRPFWSDFSGTVVTVDVPKMPVNPEADAVQIVEWGAYDHYSSGFASRPGRLAAEIIDEFGSHPFNDNNFEVALHSRRDFDVIKTEVLQGIRVKQCLNAALLHRYTPRLFFSVFGETHAAGHAFWRFQDSNHPNYMPDGNLESALLETYQAIDRAIADIVAELPRDAVLLMLSSQGFSLDSMAAEELLAEILVRMGMSAPRRSGINYAYVPYAPAVALDMSRTRAFCLPTDLQGYIRLNLHGRELHGTVRESDYESLCCELERELLALRDPTHQTPLVDRVVRSRDLYPDHRSGPLPDLSVVWKRDHVLTGVQSTRFGTIWRKPDLTGGGGNHHGSGFLLMYGRGVARRRFQGHVFDIAPTVSCLLGEANPADREGGVCRFHG